MFAFKHNVIAVSVAALATTAVTPAARADEGKPERVTITAPPPKRAPKRWLTHANAGVLAMNWTGSANNMPGKMITLADRQTTLQMFGAGRFLTPHLRVTVSVQLAEAVGGAPPGSSTLALVGVVPWLGWHPGGPWFVGTGPIVAPRIYGKNQLDVGVFTTAGAAFPIGHGFSFGAAVQIPVMLRVRTAVSVAPATFLAYRF